MASTVFLVSKPRLQGFCIYSFTFPVSPPRPLVMTCVIVGLVWSLWFSSAEFPFGAILKNPEQVLQRASCNFGFRPVTLWIVKCCCKHNTSFTIFWLWSPVYSYMYLYIIPSAAVMHPEPGVTTSNKEVSMFMIIYISLIVGAWVMESDVIASSTEMFSEALKCLPRYLCCTFSLSAVNGNKEGNQSICYRAGISVLMLKSWLLPISRKNKQKKQNRKWQMFSN